MFLQQLTLSGDIATIAFCRHVLAQGSDGFPCNHLAANRGLDRHLEKMARDELFQFFAHAAPTRLCPVAVHHDRKSVHRFGIHQDRHFNKIAGFIAGHLIIKGGIAAGDRFQPVVKVKHHLGQGQFINDHGAGTGVGQVLLAAAPVLAEF